MKLFAFLVSFILVVGSFLLFSYAFSVPEAAAGWLFFSGIVAVALGLLIPLQVLGKAD